MHLIEALTKTLIMIKKCIYYTYGIESISNSTEKINFETLILQFLSLLTSFTVLNFIDLNLIHSYISINDKDIINYLFMK